MAFPLAFAHPDAERSPSMQLRLVEGLHWRHFPAASQVLAVFYAPGNLPLPRLPHFKTTASLGCGRLLINPGNLNFYQDCIENVESVVAHVASGYDRVIHYGGSAGGYAALRFGTAAPKTQAIFALSPFFDLNSPCTRSAEQRLVSSANRSDLSVFGRVLEVAGIDIFAYISCLDITDGAQVESAERIPRGKIRLHCLLDNHALPTVNQPARLIADYLATNAVAPPPYHLLATERDRADAILAYRQFVAECQNAPFDELEPSRVSESRIYSLPYAYGRRLSIAGRHLEALSRFVEAVGKARARGMDEYELLVCAGNSATCFGWHEIALGFYREARAYGAGRGAAYVCEGHVLAALGRTDELVALAAAARRFCDEADAIRDVEAAASPASERRLAM